MTCTQKNMFIDLLCSIILISNASFMAGQSISEAGCSTNVIAITTRNVFIAPLAPNFVQKVATITVKFVFDFEIGVGMWKIYSIAFLNIFACSTGGCTTFCYSKFKLFSSKIRVL